MVGAQGIVCLECFFLNFKDIQPLGSGSKYVLRLEGFFVYLQSYDHGDGMNGPSILLDQDGSGFLGYLYL